MLRFPIAVLSLLLMTGQGLRFQERIEVRLIEVNAIVTDREGHRVYGLKPEDFEIDEGGKKQAITNFSEYRAAPVEAAAPSSREPHSLLILIDTLTPADFVRQKTFEQLEDLVSKTVRPGDHVAVIYWDCNARHPKNVLESDDPEAALRVIRNLAHGMTSDFSTQGEDQAKVASEVYLGSALAAFREKCEAIRRMVEALGTRPGKKSVLYVAQSFSLDDGGIAKIYIDDIVRAANANGVTFYAVHPALVSGIAGPGRVDAEAVLSPVAALERLTDPTGGLLALNRSAISDIVPQMTEDLESYYSIAYRAKSDGGDHTRTITVKVSNPEYRVRSRAEVVEKSAATKTREAVVSRLFVDEGADDIQFEVHEGALKRTSGDRWLLPIFVKIPAAQLQFAEEKGKQIAHAGVVIASANGVAEVTPVNEKELQISDPDDLENGFVTYSVEILGDKRGSKVSIGVVDRRTGAMGVRTIDNRNRFQ